MRRDSYARMVRIYFVYMIFSTFIEFLGDGFSPSPFAFTYEI